MRVDVKYDKEYASIWLYGKKYGIGKWLYVCMIMWHKV